MLLFVIYMEPFLVHLEALLRGLFVGGLSQASLCYMDNVISLVRKRETFL